MLTLPTHTRRSLLVPRSESLRGRERSLLQRLPRYRNTAGASSFCLEPRYVDGGVLHYQYNRLAGFLQMFLFCFDSCCLGCSAAVFFFVSL